MTLEKSQSDRLEERLIDFAARIIEFAAELPKTPAGRHISLQVLRSGTAAAPNCAEARGAEIGAILQENIELARIITAAIRTAKSRGSGNDN
jgi:hypothetical protein